MNLPTNRKEEQNERESVNRVSMLSRSRPRKRNDRRRLTLSSPLGQVLEIDRLDLRQKEDPLPRRSSEPGRFEQVHPEVGDEFACGDESFGRLDSDDDVFTVWEKVVGARVVEGLGADGVEDEVEAERGGEGVRVGKLGFERRGGVVYGLS